MSSAEVSKPSYPTLWFVCKFCNRAFEKIKQLTRHKKANHSHLLTISTEIPKSTCKQKRPSGSSPKSKTKAKKTKTKKQQQDLKSKVETKDLQTCSNSSKTKGKKRGSLEKKTEVVPSLPTSSPSSSIPKKSIKNHQPSDAFVLSRRLSAKQMQTCPGAAKKGKKKKKVAKTIRSITPIPTFKSGAVFNESATNKTNEKVMKKTLVDEDQVSVPPSLNLMSTITHMTHMQNQNASTNKDQEYIIINILPTPSGHSQVEFSSTISLTQEALALATASASTI